MRKLVQDLEKGRMEAMEVPDPIPGPHEILVQNQHSVISPGTEGKTVKDARKGYWAKAKARQEEVKKVIKTAREKGVQETYRLVKDRLRAPSPLGYSSCGVVISTGEAVQGIQTGDRVACAGKQASHAERINVPRMLCVKLPQELPSEEGAFTTIGAIAMQGIRRAELGIGSDALVIGSGLIGLATARILEASGIRPILVDTDAERIDLARRIGFEDAFERKKDDLEERILAISKDRGVDAAIITAATASTDPLELAGRLCRENAKVVMVGDAGTGFSRRNFYRKELELRMARSYGPGRHDPLYEEQERDYPIGQVRWTENRNMEAIVDLMAAGELRFSEFITHRYPFARAKEAYDGILNDVEPHLGVLLEYEHDAEPLQHIHRKRRSQGKAGPKIGLIGGGAFASNILLPSLPKAHYPEHISTRDPAMARYLGEAYGANRWSSDPEEAFRDEELDALIIATRHDSHGELVEKGLRNGKHVFVEKPLCLEEEELERIEKAYEEESGSLMVGFNRRFAPLFQSLSENLDHRAPLSIRILVNAGHLPSDHWVHDPLVGGGRIIGELCHFLDLAAAIANAPIMGIEGTALPDTEKPPDTVSATMQFQDGSIASVTYSSQGSSRLPKERIEVDQHERTLILEDFKEFQVLGKRAKRKKQKQDKGHAEQFRLWTEFLKKGGEAPIPFEQLVNSTRSTLALRKSVRKGKGL